MATLVWEHVRSSKGEGRALEERGGHGEGEGMWELGAGECSMGVKVEHEMSGVCRTGASFTHLQPTVGLSSAMQSMSLQT